VATNILGIINLQDTINAGSGGNHLAITDPVTTLVLSPGLGIAISDPLDVISIHGIFEPNYLHIDTPADIIEISALTGEMGAIAIKEALQTFSGQGYSGVLGDLALRDPLMTVKMSGTSGAIGSIAIIDPIITIAIQDLPSSHGALAIKDPLDIIWINGKEVPITYLRKAIVMHLFGHAVTEYKNFNFNSLAHFKEHFLGANENGLFILGGKDDLGVPIQADIRTGIHDLASDGVIKLPKEAWIGYRTNGQLELDIEVDENKAPYPYTFDKTSQRITEARSTLGKGLKERFYTFILKNISGSDFDLESLRILGNVIGRKRR
jgi:hypothetical protein